MTREITADFHTLMGQASGTADTYMGEAVERIDRQFGEGFAKKNPGLVGAFIQTAAIDMGFAVLAQQLRAGLQSIADALHEIADNMGDDNAVADALGTVAQRLDRIAYGLSGGYDGDPADSVPDALRSAARIVAGEDE